MNNKKRPQITHAVNKVTEEQAAAFFILAGVYSSAGYWHFMRERLDERPPQIPAHPHEFYDTFTGWDAFFQKGQAYLDSGGTIPQVPTLDELKQRVTQQRITSRAAFRRASCAGDLGPCVPRNPSIFYGDDFNWDDVLLPKEAAYLSYEEASCVIRQYGLRTRKEWRQFCRDGRRPNCIPALPSRDYPDFVSWRHFLTGEID